MIIPRRDLEFDLARVCHQTWMRQKKEPPLDPPPDPDDPTPTAHDHERARDIVDRLIELGVYKDTSR